jgi:hypothetical protein
MYESILNNNIANLGKPFRLPPINLDKTFLQKLPPIPTAKDRSYLNRSETPEPVIPSEQKYNFND